METIIEKLERIGEERGLLRGRQEGRQQGRQEGRLEGATAVTLYLLQKKFGKIGRKTESQVRKLSVEKLEELGGALLEMEKRKELTDWLRRHETSTTH